MMTTEEIQAKIDAAVEAAMSKSSTEIEKLRNKNSELLNEKRTAKAQADEAEERATTLAEDAARSANDTAALEKTIATRYMKQMDILQKERDTASNTLSTLLIDNGITNALTAANVAPSLVRAAAALLRSETQIAISEGSATINGQPLADYVKTWSQTTEGRDFIAPPLNSGGNSTGSTGKTPAIVWTKQRIATSEFADLVKTDRVAAVAALRQAGMDDVAEQM